MGLFKKVFRPVRKIAKKIIPKEIRPFLPYIAAGFGPSTAGLTFGSGLGTALAQRGLIAAATSAATDEQGNPLRAGILAAAPGAVEGGLRQFGQAYGTTPALLKAQMAGEPTTSNFLQNLGTQATKLSQNKTLQTLADPRSASGLTNKAIAYGTPAAIDQSAKFAEIRQDEIDEYNRSLQEQGVLDKTKRRTAIFNIYKNAGYEDDYVNSMLDRYGYDDGGEVKDIPGKGKKTGIEKIFEKLNEKKDDDEDTSKNLAGGLMAAAEGVEKAFGRGFGEVEPVPMLRFARGGRAINYESYKDFIEQTGDDELMDLYIEFLGTGDFTKLGDALKRKGFARGGEVEIEEQVDDLGIMDLMKDQGIPYGEQASYGFDDAMGETFEMFLDYKKKGTIPMEMEFDEFLELLQGRKEQGIKGTQVASGYKSDIEEMYEQYVFEMEEQGLEPMDFASFLRQARSGMADGGRVGFTKGGDVMRGVDRGIDPLEVLDILEEFKRIKEKYGYEMSFDDYLDGEVFADGGKVKRRKKGEPADEVIETEEEIFLDKMPRPKRKGIIEVASGGIMNKNLLNTGMDKDMRGGGFIPEGTKEKADDVPARLSKNEFVMTADAVRAAGGGSVNKGAKRMYDLMYTLEAKV